MPKLQVMPGFVPAIRSENDKNTLGLRFTADHFPVSASFAIFLEQMAFGESTLDVNMDWGDQVTEKMNGRPADLGAFAAKVKSAANRAFNTPVGRSIALHAYNMFGDLLTGNTQVIGGIQTTRRYVVVVSAPRHGGSYLTKELYRATGVDHKTVPNFLAHDGYPDGGPFWYNMSDGLSVPATRTTIQQTAEWLIMSDWFFRDMHPVDGYKSFVKKGTKMVYHADFFQGTFGPLTEWVVIVRHPVAGCVSLYEKAGGLPEDGLFPIRARSVIERWVMESWIRDGFTPKQVGAMPYFTAYLHYWMRYHQTMAIGGMLRGNRRMTVLGYHPDQAESFIKGQLNRYGVASDPNPEKFYCSGKAGKLHPDWVAEAAPVIADMKRLWASFGVELPGVVDEVL
ncbi:hypothetical protein [Acidithiobacillus ferrianus]|uniref:hypothetical protein n=1 Tax=Acidithiobacillus ferrianus TaxID=2678518 RepID=UPI0034E42CF6